MYQDKLRDSILALINEMEQSSKDLIESIFTKRRVKKGPNSTELQQIADSLVATDVKLKDLIIQAQEQEQIKKKMDMIKEEINKKDEEIRQLQKSLSEAEHILATALYEAKNKLNLMKPPISSEELIRYANKISSAHAVVAPYNWEPGDQRRPYPTDIEMRSGKIQQQGTFTNPSGPQMNKEGVHNNEQPSSFTWQNDIKFNIPKNSSSSLDINKGNLEEVEVMSTDSSSGSASSSDS